MDRIVYKSRETTMLYIEDNPDGRLLVRRVLEAEGYRVATAASATEARTLINHIDEEPALIVSDFHLLDGSTGVEAVVDIREHFERNIPAFIVTGDTSKVVKEAQTVDNCTLLNKPVNTVRLLSAARAATGLPQKSSPAGLRTLASPG